MKRRELGAAPATVQLHLSHGTTFPFANTSPSCLRQKENNGLSKRNTQSYRLFSSGHRIIFGSELVQPQSCQVGTQQGLAEVLWAGLSLMDGSFHGAAASQLWAQLGTTSLSSLAQKRVAQVMLAPVTWLPRCPLLPEILRTERLALPLLFRAMPRS